MRLCLLPAVTIVWLACVVWLPARARAQSDREVSPVVLVHADVSTVLQLPDEILDVRSADNRDIMVKGVGSELYLRPKPDTPAGVEVFIELETRTLHRIFLVRVVERAEDATQRLAMPVAPVAKCAEADPGASAPEAAPATPESGEPEPATAAATGHPAAAGSSRFEFSVHAVAALGTTELNRPGYEPISARQSHQGLGIRVAGRRPGALWGLEANVSGEWPVAPTAHDSEEDDELQVSGPWLRVDGGLRLRFDGRLIPTAYVGGGLQAHYRDAKEAADGENDGIGDMPFAGVLAGGVGLEYRAGDVVLGLELHVRQGVPAEYRSVSGFLSVGLFLDQGE